MFAALNQVKGETISPLETKAVQFHSTVFHRKQLELKVKRLCHEVVALFPSTSHLEHSNTVLIISITFQNCPRPINVTPFQLSNQFNRKATISHPSVTVERQHKHLAPLPL